MGYEFTNDWFQTKAKPVWDEIMPQILPKRILEIGSYEGASACYLIDTVAPKIPDGEDFTIVCVDTWQGGAEHKNIDMSEVKRRFEHNTNLAIENSPKEQVWLMPREDKSIKALSNFIDEKWKPFDMIYVDGSHHAQDVLGDLVLSFNLLEKGGIMICDDYLWAQNHPDMRFTPRMAVNAFTEIFGDKIIMLQAPLYQVYMKKIAD